MNADEHGIRLSWLHCARAGGRFLTQGNTKPIPATIASFAASTDGGETFTPPQAVSRAVSSPNRAELEKLDYLKTRYRGGDYFGLAAASDSVFHAAWADARDGLFRIFHAPIRIAPG
jgi:hypothetical protein